MSQNDRSGGRTHTGPARLEGLVDAAAHDSSAPALLPGGRTAGTQPTGNAHGAAVVASDAEVLAAALPFIDAGLRAGDLVALTCQPDTVAVLCEALGER